MQKMTCIVHRCTMYTSIIQSALPKMQEKMELYRKEARRIVESKKQKWFPFRTKRLLFGCNFGSLLFFWAALWTEKGKGADGAEISIGT